MSTPARNPAELRAAFRQLERRTSIRLDEALRQLGSVDTASLERARAIKAEKPTVPFGTILLSIGGASEETIRAGLAFQLGVPEVDIRHWIIDPAMSAELPIDVVRFYRAVPIHAEGNILYVAMSDVLNTEVIDALRLATASTVRAVYARDADILWLLSTQFLAGASLPVTDEDLRRNTDQYASESAASLVGQLAPTDNVIVRLADQIIAEAHRDRASDIHIEPLPQHKETRVRVRIDGRMFMRRSIPWAYRDALVSRIKVMANLNVAEHRTPQDGKIFFRNTGGAPIELRVAVLPTAGGVEDVVLRILDASAALPLASLGLCESDHARLRDLIDKPYGILLVCGPTGSGKTTTLHAVLHHLNDGSNKIWTVENPVEITQPGLRQVEVNPRAGLTFATALRAFLRADPDVIMVGEIRDTETAKTALESSLTGHLVLSTLHTNNAPESVIRLIEMGMNPLNFSDSLLGVLAQRLARCLCRHCRQPRTATDEMLLQLAREYCTEPRTPAEYRRLIDEWRRDHGEGGVITLYAAEGCEACVKTGYKGRIGLFELMTATSEIKRMIIDGAAGAGLFEVAVRQGMQTLKQDGILKVLGGVTDLGQVLAVSER